MKILNLLIWPAALTAGLGMTSSFALAQDEDAAVSLSANAAVVSEYRFRGVNMSDGDFAIQGGLDVSTAPGFYIGTWGSSIQDFNGAEAEIDLYGGFARDVGNVSLDAGVIAYLYPGGVDTNYYEIAGSVGTSVNNFGFTVGANYVPSQSNVGGTDNIYLHGEVEYAVGDTPFALSGHIAYEDGAFGTNKFDWLVGVAYSFQQFSLGVQYIGFDQSGMSADSTVVFSVGASF